MPLKISINQDELNNELNTPLNFDSLCSICGSNILENENNHILSCSHKFHYYCLLKFLKTDLSNPRSNKCPYCRQEFNYLPLLNGMKPIKYIHYEYQHPQQNNQIKSQCIGIYLSGINKGLMCNNFVNQNNSYCRYHTKKNIDNINNTINNNN
jgi:hypothetical protein